MYKVPLTEKESRSPGGGAKRRGSLRLDATYLPTYLLRTYLPTQKDGQVRARGGGNARPFSASSEAVDRGGLCSRRRSSGRRPIA